MKKTFKKTIENLKALKIPSKADPKEITNAIVAALKMPLDFKPEAENLLSLDISAITNAATQAATKAATDAVMQSPPVLALEQRLKAAEENDASMRAALAPLFVSDAGVLENAKPKIVATWGKAPETE